MEEWEANPFSTLGFIVSVVVKIQLFINVLGTIKGVKILIILLWEKQKFFLRWKLEKFLILIPNYWIDKYRWCGTTWINFYIHKKLIYGEDFFKYWNISILSRYTYLWTCQWYHVHYRFMNSQLFLPMYIYLTVNLMNLYS